MKKSSVVVGLILAAIILITATALIYLNNRKPTENLSIEHFTYIIVNTYPHDSHAFTEGLFYSDGFLFESTGAFDSLSSLRRVNLTSGTVVQEYTLSTQYFGEGIAIVNNTIIQLTYQSHIGFIYDKDSFAILGNFTYSTEGWGLTFDGKKLIMSDGTDQLYFIDPGTFQRTGQIIVHDGNSTVKEINSLDYINGSVYANIWHTNNIAIIDPQSGQVKGWIDLSGLPDENNSNPEAVLNGIAYDQANNRLFVAGKDWPNLYQIQLIPKTLTNP